MRLPACVDVRRVIPATDERPDLVGRTASFDEERTGNRFVQRILDAPPFHLFGVPARALFQRSNGVWAERRSDVFQDASELGNRRQDVRLAAAVPAAFFAIDPRMVFVPDDGEGFIGVLREVGRRTYDRLQRDPGPQRIQRQGMSGLAAAKKHVETFPVCCPLDFSGPITGASRRCGSFHAARSAGHVYQFRFAPNLMSLPPMISIALPYDGPSCVVSDVMPATLNTLNTSTRGSILTAPPRRAFFRFMSNIVMCGRRCVPLGSTTRDSDPCVSLAVRTTR